MQQLYRMLGRVCSLNCSVLLVGEPGTGKSVVARALHHFSHRSGPFIHLDGKELQERTDEELLEITDAHHEDSTFYITDWKLLPIFVQNQLLRIYRSGQYVCGHSGLQRNHNFRFVFSFEKGFQEPLQEESIPSDHFYDWNLLPLFIPSLRERKDDIRLYTGYFLERLASETKIPHKELSPEAMEILGNYDWPGNLTEMKEVLRSALSRCRGNYIRTEHLPDLRKPESAEKEAREHLKAFLHSKLSTYIQNAVLTEEGNLYRVLLPHMEKPLLEYALKKSRGNKNKAAKILGLHRNTLNKKLHRT